MLVCVGENEDDIILKHQLPDSCISVTQFISG